MQIKNVKLLRIFLVFTLILTSPLYAKNINVGFEPFPPMIGKNGQGQVVEMLRAIEKVSDFRFNVKVMTYARAKLALKNQQLDLIGLTPQYLETEDFYTYAQDINWNIAAHVDIFSLKNDLIDIAKIPKASIGTLIGNADFFAELLDIPREKFIEVIHLEQLVKMLAKGRLELVTFERVAMMSTIKHLQINGIYYQKFGVIPASMAVANNIEGHKLKLQLDELLLNISDESTKAETNCYRNLPYRGLVNINL